MDGFLNCLSFRPTSGAKSGEIPRKMKEATTREMSRLRFASLDMTKGNYEYRMMNVEL